GSKSLRRGFGLSGAKAERNDAEDEPHAKWGFSSAAVKGYEAMAFPEFAPSHFPKNMNPKMVNRNRRMLGIFIPFKIYNGFDHDYGG
ncbi:LOW QUALITY PROTEIN: hypothetical protein HID58_042709, partial [Brassica napus]